ncbi:hypothetical protein cyc_06461 [Cyclospora cayetanensis]|uniref:Uncharacterized protein n=1 Tax=Cyclospora cayetanensis TaxID=88456 RepID=A0A1D3D5M3_9EIME|nr:hypothetical protein cyc_06461 [Cyclospora cayetanensis]
MLLPQSGGVLGASLLAPSASTTAVGGSGEEGSSQWKCCCSLEEHLRLPSVEAESNNCQEPQSSVTIRVSLYRSECNENQTPVAALAAMRSQRLPS